MCFGASLGALDGWAVADIDGGEDAVGSGLGGELCVARVDSVAWEEGLGVEVDGWDVDGASELLSLLDGACEFVGSAEDVGGVADAAVGEEPADEG